MSNGKIIGLVIAAVIGIALISAAIWGIGVAFSPVKGQGEAYKTKNSSENWTKAQGKFEDLYADIQAADKKAKLATDALAANPTDLTLQQTHSGLVSGCLNLIADYNAESRKYLAADFKAADLPHQIDETDRSTDCK